MKKDANILRVASWNIQRNKNRIKPILEIMTTNEEIDIISLHEVEILTDTEDAELNVRGYEQFSTTVRRQVGNTGKYVDKIRTITYVKEGLFDEVKVIDKCSNGRSESWLRLKNKGVKDIVYVAVYNEWTDGKPGIDNEDLMNQLKKRTSSDVFIHGDWNIDLDRVQEGDKTYSHYGVGSELLQKLERMGMDRHGSGTTREEAKRRGGDIMVERSSIDWAASNIPGIQHFSERQVFSDHRVIISDIPYTRVKDRGGEKTRIRNLRNLSSEECIAALNNYDWEAMGSMTLEEMGSFMRRVMVDVLERYAPLRWKKVKQKPRHVPTKEEKELRLQLNKRLERRDHLGVKSIRKKLRRCMRRNRIEQFNSNLEKGKTNMWKAFKEVTKKAKTDVVLIENGRKIIGDQCAEKFAAFFAGKIKKLKASCTPTLPDLKTDEELKAEGIEKFEFRLLKESAVKKLIQNSKPSSAADMYGISPKMLKEWACKSDFLLAAVTYIINFSILSGEIPSEWKISKLYPNYKNKGSRHLTSSYRPIALGNPCIKIFEAAINEQIVDFLESRKYLSQSQHGYRKNRSTISATAHLGDRIDEAKQRGLHTGIICFDYSSAFDMIDAKILGGKLHNMGFGGTAVALMTNYMKDRSIVVEASGGKSGTINFKSLSPQGSKLSPTVYLAATYDINAVIESIKGCFSVTYADDTNVVCTATTLMGLKTVMEKVCDKIRKYSSDNGLCLNAAKTEFVIIRGRKADSFCVEFDGEKIQESRSVRFLGIVTSNDMSGMHHLDSVTSEVNKRISMIRRLREYFPQKTLITLVKSCVMSKLLYGSEVWCNVSSSHEKGVLQRVEVLTKKAIRAATGDIRGDVSSEALWEKSKVERPKRTILRKVAVAAFDIYNVHGAWNFLKRETHFKAERSRRTPYEDQIPVLADACSLRNRATRVQNCLPAEMKELSFDNRYRTLQIYKRLFNINVERIEEDLKMKYFKN